MEERELLGCGKGKEEKEMGDRRSVNVGRRVEGRYVGVRIRG